MEPSREKFEKWISGPPFERSTKRYLNDPAKFAWAGNYFDIAVELAWEAWKASAIGSEAQADFGSHGISPQQETEVAPLSVSCLIHPCPPVRALDPWELMQAERDSLQAQLAAKDAEMKDVVDSWRTWHAKLREILGSKYNERNVTLEAAKHLQAQLAASERKVAELEQWIRVRVALGHGCDGIYGDDGELQCNNIGRHGKPLDFKRMEIQEVFALDTQCKLEAAGFLAARKEG